jgi:hypothetical protein
MNAQTASPTPTTEHRVSEVLAPIGITTALVAIGCTAVGVFYQGPNDDHKHSVWEFIVAAGIIIVTSAFVFGFFLPKTLRKEATGKAALTLSVLAALVLLPAFWSGLPLVLGVAGALVGYLERHAANSSWRSTAAVALGLLTAVGYLAIYILDTVDRARIL